jgi:hypothetical protein
MSGFRELVLSVVMDPVGIELWGDDDGSFSAVEFSTSREPDDEFIPLYGPHDAEGLSAAVDDRNASYARSLRYRLDDAHEAFHEGRYNDERRRGGGPSLPERPAPLFASYKMDDGSFRYRLRSEAIACFRACMEYREKAIRVAYAFAAASGGRVGEDNALRAGRIAQYIEDVNEALRRAAARRPDVYEHRPLSIPDPFGDDAAFVRDSAAFSRLANTAAIARAVHARSENPGRILYEIADAIGRNDAAIDALIAPKGRPGALELAQRYSDAVAATAGGAEAWLMERWQTGAIATPTIAAADSPYRTLLKPADIFVGNLYAMATLRMGASKGRYAAVAEIEVDELLRHLARPKPKTKRIPAVEAAMVDLRPDKIVLTSDKKVTDRGPDGVYDLSDGYAAELRGAIGTGEDDVLLISEVKTSVSSSALSTSINEIGGDTVKKARGTKNDPDYEREAVAYLIWGIGKTLDLLEAKVESAGLKSDDHSLSNDVRSIWTEQARVWKAMRSGLEAELQTVIRLEGPEQREWFRNRGERRVSTILVVRACSLFSSTTGETEMSDWGAKLPPRALGLFDRVLVLDLFGLPVPGLCLERDGNDGQSLASMTELVPQILEYNRRRFPELLRRTLSAGFDPKDEKELLDVLIRKGGDPS